MRRSASLLAVLIFLAVSSAAHADTYLFTFPGYAFQLPSSPTTDSTAPSPPYAPPLTDIRHSFFGLSNVYFYDPRTNQPFYYLSLLFPEEDPGGLWIGVDGYEELAGPQLFTGSVLQPTFKLGTFTLNLVGAGVTETLTISDISPASVPEPGTLALLSTGLAAAAVRRRWRSA